jgi:F-type H+-transporting ATPase subunit c
MLKSVARSLFVLVVVLFASAPAFAQTEDKVAKSEVKTTNTGAPIGMGIAVFGIGLGLGLIGHSALASMARQPEQAGKLQGVMILLAALVEGAGIIAIILCFVLGS